MKLFKKKHERSAWFEGLLEAEKLYSEGYHYHKNDGIHMWFRLADWHETLGDLPQYIRYRVSDPRCIGVVDYLRYRKEYLK